MFTKNKLSAIFLTLIFLLFAGGFAFAGTMDIIEGRLQFQLGSNAISVRGSTSDYQGNEEADIWFSPEWINGPPPAGIITSIEVNFTFDETLYEFTGAEKTAEWPGDFDYIHNGNHIYLLFSGAGVAPQEGFKKFAYIHFTAKCQPYTGQVGSWLVFDDDTYRYTNYAMVTEGVVTDMYVANPRFNGFLMINIYRHIYTIDNVEAYLGNEVTVPVYAETDFRMFSFHQFINFDYSNLDVVDVIPNPAVFPDIGNVWYWSEPEPGLLEVYLAWECIFWPSCFVSERPAGTKLYDIIFRVSGNQDDITLPLTFVDADCFDSAWTADRPYDPCEELDNSINPPGLIDGSITIPSYLAAYEAACDADYIAKSGGTQQVTFKMRMSSTFPAGDYSDQNDNGGIEALFELQPFLSFIPPVVEDFPDLDFHSISYANGETILRLYQYYNSQLPGNFWPPTPELSPLLTMNFSFNESIYEPSYDDRTIALKFRDNFVGGGYDWHTHVEDTTGSVSADSANGRLTWTSIPVEVKMGEFFSNYATSPTTSVDQDLFIRANFDMGEFSVSVSVDNGWTISSVTTYENVQAERLEANAYRIYFDDPYFHDATGDDPVTIATIRYRAVCSTAKTGGESPGPGGSYNVYASTSFFDAYIHDDAAYDHFVDLSPSGLRATCGGSEPIPRDVINKDQLAALPAEFNLYPNRPNPFNPATAIAYDVPAASHVKIEIVNILGRKVATLVDELQMPGRYEAMWNGIDENGVKVSSGIYLYSMQAGNFIQTRKMILMK